MNEPDKFPGFKVIKHVEKPCDCRHRAPRHEEFYIGTIIECEKCGTQYRLEDSQRSGSCWVLHNPKAGPYDEND